MNRKYKGIGKGMNTDMRSQLLIAGAFSVGLGILLDVIALPVVSAWSIPLIVGGGLMAVVSPFLKESEGPLAPPEGYRFCAFCSTPVLLSEERCGHCGGRQPPLQG